MTKKIFIFLFFIIFAFPSYVLAATCDNGLVISGGGGSVGTTNSPNNGCDDVICLDINYDTGHYVGVRVQIYKYTGTGDFNDIKLVGTGVDIWATNNLKVEDFYFSDPSTPNVQKKATCSDVHSKNCVDDKCVGPYGNRVSNIYKLTPEKYLNSKAKIVYDKNLWGIFKSGVSGALTNYLLKTNNDGTAKSGWIKNNLIDKITSKDDQKRKEVMELFNLTDANISDMMRDSDNYYISAEVLYRWKRVKIPNENRLGYVYGGEKGWYLGTVSEASRFYGFSGTYNALYLNTKVGKLVSSSKTGSYLINTVSPLGGEDSKNFIAYYNYNNINSSGSIPGKAACRYGYGMNIWNLGGTCDECHATCSNACAGKQGAELNICGRTYCESNYSNKSDIDACLEGCSFSCGGKGCNNNTTCSVVKKVKDTTKSETCESNSSGQVKLTPTTTCESIGDDKLVKVECTEEFTSDMADLKNKKVVVNSKGNANISLTFKINFKKTCNVIYAKKIANRKSGGNTCYVDTVNYNESELKTEITETENLLKKLNNDTNLKKECQYDACMKNAGSNKDEQKKCTTFCDNLKKNAQNKLKELNELASKAENELRNKVTEIGTDGKNGTKSETVQLELKYIPTDLKGKSLTETKTAVMKLVPIACNTTTEVEWCDPETKTQVKSSKDVITCDRDPNDVEIVINPKTNGKSAVYEEEVYYSIPSSWIETRTDAEGTIYHDYLISDNGKDRSININDLRTGKKECENSKTVKAANGLCIEIPNTWTFNKLSDGQLEQLREVAKEVKITEGLKVTIAGKGSCGQFGYTLTCNYTEMAYKTCSDKCDKYKIGTEDFNKCVAKECGCDSLCGDNVGCRTTYCPDPCPTCIVENECKDNECQDQCSEYTEGTAEYNKCITENDCCDSYCKKKVADKTYTSEEQCKLKVCPAPTPPPPGEECETKCNESIACLCNCCTEKCETKVKNGEYKTVDDCRKVECPECDCPDCSDAYIYRTVDVASPFPDRDPGENWFGKVDRITSNQTNAANDDVPEYSITLNSSQLNDLTKLYKNELKFKKFSNLEEVATVSNLSAKEYCSSMLHGGDDKSRDIFSDLKINVKTGCVK